VILTEHQLIFLYYRPFVLDLPIFVKWQLQRHRTLPILYSSGFLSHEETLWILLQYVTLPWLGSKLTLQVDWDATKDATLWKILSQASKNNDIDCKSLAVLPI
jgi:hypothetical protein